MGSPYLDDWPRSVVSGRALGGLLQAQRRQRGRLLLAAGRPPQAPVAVTFATHGVARVAYPVNACLLLACVALVHSYSVVGLRLEE